MQKTEACCMRRSFKVQTECLSQTLCCPDYSGMPAKLRCTIQACIYPGPQQNPNVSRRASENLKLSLSAHQASQWIGFNRLGKLLRNVAEDR